LKRLTKSIQHQSRHSVPAETEATCGYSTICDPEDGGNIKLWNVSNYSFKNRIASHLNSHYAPTTRRHVFTWFNAT